MLFSKGFLKAATHFARSPQLPWFYKSKNSTIETTCHSTPYQVCACIRVHKFAHRYLLSSTSMYIMYGGGMRTHALRLRLLACLRHPFQLTRIVKRYLCMYIYLFHIHTYICVCVRMYVSVPQSLSTHNQSVPCLLLPLTFINNYQNRYPSCSHSCS